MKQSESVLPLGFSEEDLAATASLSTNEGMDSGLADELRFLSGTVKALLYRKSMAGAELDSTFPSIVFCGSVPESLAGSTKVYLANKGQIEMTGRRWFTNTECSAGSYLVHSDSAEQLLEQANADEDMRHRPTIVYLPDVEEAPIVFYPFGVADESARVDYDLRSSATILPEQGQKAVTDYYNQVMVTPTGMYGSARFWVKDDGKRVPVAQAENVIQGYIRAALIGRFPDTWVHEEGDTKAGRYDLLITSRQERTSPPLGVVELKVLRVGDTIATILDDGIDQAYNYGIKLSSPWAQLWCFDMRDADPKEDVFTTHQSKADALNVLLAKWFLFVSAKKYRRFVAAEALRAS